MQRRLRRRSLEKEITMRFFYLRDEHGHPIGCLASDLDKTTNTIKYAVSVCNPIDIFSKEDARIYTAGRLALGQFDSIPLDKHKGKTKQHILEFISLGVTKTGMKIPQRAKDAAKRWLAKHEALSNLKPSAFELET